MLLADVIATQVSFTCARSKEIGMLPRAFCYLLSFYTCICRLEQVDASRTTSSNIRLINMFTKEAPSCFLEKWLPDISCRRMGWARLSGFFHFASVIYAKGLVGNEHSHQTTRRSQYRALFFSLSVTRPWQRQRTFVLYSTSFRLYFFRPYNCPCPGASCKWQGSLEQVMPHLMQQHKSITTLQGEDIVFLATDINLPGAVDWVMMQSCFDHNFMLVLEKQERYEGQQLFYAIVQLIGTKKQAENFAYRWASAPPKGYCVM